MANLTQPGDEYKTNAGLPTRRSTPTHSPTTTSKPLCANFAQLLERAGFKIRGRRADCPYCSGTSRLTVSINEETFFCHRCGRKGGVHSLALEYHYTVPAETIEHREARRLAQEFSDWADRCDGALIDRHRLLWRRTGLAIIALRYFPEMPQAWDALADYYHVEARLCASMDTLSFEKASRWLDEPMTPEKLFRSWWESYARH